MNLFKLRPWLATASFCVCAVAQADVLSDSELQLDLRNFFYDRDYHGDAARQSRRHEWAQGATLDWRSGWTPGPVAFGLDVTGTLGIKLDSSTAQSGSGLLPRDSDGEPEDAYSTLYPTLKAKWSDNELRLGLLSPQLPLLASNGSRLFPQRFRGLQWTGKGPAGLTGHALHLDRTRLRDSSGFDGLALTPQAGSYDVAASTNGLDYLGIDWKLAPYLTMNLHGERVRQIMQRTYLGARFDTALGPGDWFAELRYFDARGEGREIAGPVDNKTLTTQVGYRWQGHTFSGGVQRGWGETAYAYLNGADTYLFSEQLVSTFGFPSERVVHLRYDYDFATLGIPGLTLNVRYVKGADIDLSSLTSSGARTAFARGEEGREWERTLDLNYVIQDGPFKNVYLRWRNGHYQSNFSDPADENRLTVGYRLKLW